MCIRDRQETLEESGVSVSVEGVPLSYDELSGSGQLLSFFAGNTTLILAVLISLFVGSEFNHGTIKNMASRQYSRADLYGSKLITGMAAGAFLTLVYVLFAAVTASILWGFGPVSSGYWPCLLYTSFFLRLCISGVHVRMILLGNLSVCFFQSRFVSISANTQHLIIISL